MKVEAIFAITAERVCINNIDALPKNNTIKNNNNNKSSKCTKLQVLRLCREKYWKTIRILLRKLRQAILTSGYLFVTKTSILSIFFLFGLITEINIGLVNSKKKYCCFFSLFKTETFFRKQILDLWIRNLQLQQRKPQLSPSLSSTITQRKQQKVFNLSEQRWNVPPTVCVEYLQTSSSHARFGGSMTVHGIGTPHWRRTSADALA